MAGAARELGLLALPLLHLILELEERKLTLLLLLQLVGLELLRLVLPNHRPARLPRAVVVVRGQLRLQGALSNERLLE